MSFTELYDRYFDKVYNYVRYHVKLAAEADDITGKVFESALNKFESFNPARAPAQAWLFTIARNAVIDYYREKKSDVPLDELENTLEYENNIVDAMNLSQDQQMFMAALKQLPAEQQIVIKLKFIEDLDTPTIAEMLHKSEGAIRVIQHRAITKLQELINKRINNH